MTRLRIVLDTSVLVSAALKPLGQPALVIHSIALGLAELCLSKDVLSEHREVLARPKFAHLDLEESARLLAMIEAEGMTVAPTEPLNISNHSSDNRFYSALLPRPPIHRYRQSQALQQTVQTHENYHTPAVVSPPTN